VCAFTVPPHPPSEMAGFEPARPVRANTCLHHASDEPRTVTAGVQGALPTGRRSLMSAGGSTHAPAGP
jgi:hypothetical protein